MSVSGVAYHSLPAITVNGVVLNDAQTVTVCSALSAFQRAMSEPSVIGPRDRELAASFARFASEIVDLMKPSPVAGDE